ncbi:hypothetical protein LguiA_009193 [Lonicera macranthoides]
MMLKGKACKLTMTFSNISHYFRQSFSPTQSTVPLLIRSRSFSSTDGVPSPSSRLEQHPPEPIPNRPLRGEKSTKERRNFDDDDNRSGGYKFDRPNQRNPNTNPKPNRVVGNKPNRQSVGSIFQFDEDEGEKTKFSQTSPTQSSKNADFLEKFKLGLGKEEKPLSNARNPQLGKKGEEVASEKGVTDPPMTPPQDADEIFKKMKETGLIPNAVAMLDGLCKDGLVQEAMKLFSLMREKGTIPEVVIYTAVVEGFCKAQKLDDAKRIFRKMQNNGIVPNAFSYTVLIQGLYKGKILKDALEFCVEMLETGHSPNLATFAGLVDGFCREKGLEEAKSVIVTLREKGFFFDEKAAREFLDKKGPFLPVVWEAILGKKSSQRMPF